MEAGRSFNLFSDGLVGMWYEDEDRILTDLK
jgi:hypothetical protein